MCNLQSNFIRPEPNSHEDKKMQNKSIKIDVIEDYHKQMALKGSEFCGLGFAMSLS